MKMKGLKKLLVSLGLCAVLTIGMSTAAFADSTEAILAPAPEENSIPEVPVLSTEEVDNATYVGSTSNIAQTAATETSISLAWNKVEGATKYTIRIKSSNGADSYKVLGTTSKTKCKINKLKPGKAYTVAILAGNDSEESTTVTTIICATLYKSVGIKTSYSSDKGYTFNMKTVTPYNAITGYKVAYTSYKTKKTTTKFYNNRYTFTLPLQKDAFYKVEIYPYLTLQGKKFVSTTPTTRYVAKGIVPKKAGNTRNSMTIKWNKVAGAQSYTVYVKYPGNSSYKKAATTSANSFRLNNMTLGTRYYVKIAANKKVGKKTWQSDKNSAYYLYLRRV